jgi:transcriptional regulator GlxA family with amidase domain
MAASLVRRYISKDAERNALEVLQIDRARSSTDIQPRRPLYEDFEDARVKAALITMEQHIEGNVSIERLAEKVGLSRRQLERIFLEKAGMSPARAYNRVRLERARILLTQTKTSMIEVALDVGFDNASHFARCFKRLYGQTPSQIRAAAGQS